MHNGSSFIRAWMEADDPDSESLGRPDSHTVRSSVVHAQQLTGRQMSWQECMMASAEGGQSHEPRTTISLLLYFQLSDEMLYRSRSLSLLPSETRNIPTNKYIYRANYEAAEFCFLSLCADEWVRLAASVVRNWTEKNTHPELIALCCVSYKQSGD